MNYATADELQAYVDASGAASFSAADRSNMETALSAASRWIDEQLDTQFAAVAATRYFTACWPDLCYIDDLAALTSLKTDEDGDGVCEAVWTDADYILEPTNAAGKGRPYRQIRRRANGSRSFPTGVDAVEVVGSFGYAVVVPGPIKQATLLLAARLWRRKDAIFGVAGTPGLGVTIVQAKITADSDVMALLEGVDRRHV